MTTPASTPEEPSVHQLLSETRSLLDLLHRMSPDRRQRLVPVVVRHLVSDSGAGLDALTWSRRDPADAIDQVGDVLVDVLQDGLGSETERIRVLGALGRCMAALERELAPHDS